VFALHALAAIFAAFRLVEMLHVDKIAEPLRKKWGHHYLMNCIRCSSVWIGALVTAMFIWTPWLAWPLAISWLYITWNDLKTLHIQSKSAPAAPPRSLPMATSPEQRVKEALGDLTLKVVIQAAEIDALKEEIERLKGGKVVPQEAPHGQNA